MRKSITLLLLFTAVFAAAQQDYRTWLRGKVLYQDSSVVAANIPVSYTHLTLPTKVTV